VLGPGKVTVTPTESGWTFAGDGNLAGMVGALRGACGSPRHPPPVTRGGLAREPMAPAKPALETS